MKPGHIEQLDEALADEKLALAFVAG